MDPLVIKVPEETPEHQECPGRMGRQGTLDSQDRKVTQALVEYQDPLDFLDPKDRLEEWACQVRLERKAFRASLAHRVSPAHLERREPRERKGSQVCLALEFPDGLVTRGIRGLQVSQAALVRRERKAVPEPQGCQGPQAQEALQGTSAIQEAQACLEKKETKASQDWMVFPVSKEKQVFLGLLAPQAQLARRENLAVMESQGRQERRVNKVCQEEASQASRAPKETKVPRVKWVSLASPEVLGFLEPKASKDSWVLLALKDNRAYLALLVTPWRGPKETEDLRVNPACQGFRDLWGHQGSLESMGRKVTREIQVGQELPGLQALRETQDSKACRALAALQGSQVQREIWDRLAFQDSKVRKVFLACRE